MVWGINREKRQNWRFLLFVGASLMESNSWVFGKVACGFSLFLPC